MRGYIQERGPGTYRIRISLGWDPKTRRYKEYSETFHGSKREAEARAGELVAKLNATMLPDPGRMTVGEYLDRWLEEAQFRPRTAGWARIIVEKHLKPALGHIRLRKLTALHVQRYFRTAARQDGREGTLSANTLRGHYRLLHSALAQAVNWKLLSENPADGVRLPSADTSSARALSPAELARVLEVAKGYRYGTLYLAGAATGMRLSELLGLRWQDVNLEQGLLFVRQTLERPGRNATFGEVKNKTSRRVIRLPKVLVDALRERRAEYESEKAFFGASYHDRDLVFSTLHGNPISSSTVNKCLDTILRRAGVPHVRFHDLRHSNATWLLLSGVDVKTVSAHLGHAQTSTTVDIYAHVLAAVQDKTARVIDELFGDELPEGAGRNVAKIRPKTRDREGRSAGNSGSARAGNRS